MTEHVHRWRFGLAGWGDEYFRCEDLKGVDKGCQAVLSIDEAELRLNEYETLKKATEKLRVALLVVLDATDYTAHNCRVNEMVGAVLPKELIVMAREAIAYADILEEIDNA